MNWYDCAIGRMSETVRSETEKITNVHKTNSSPRESEMLRNGIAQKKTEQQCIMDKRMLIVTPLCSRGDLYALNVGFFLAIINLPFGHRVECATFEDKCLTLIAREHM